MSDTDKKAIKARNEVRASRIAHISGCAICGGWIVLGIKEDMRQPRPQSRAYLEAHRDHLREIGGFDNLGYGQIGKRLAMVDELPQSGYAKYELGTFGGKYA